MERRSPLPPLLTSPPPAALSVRCVSTQGRVCSHVADKARPHGTWLLRGLDAALAAPAPQRCPIRRGCRSAVTRSHALPRSLFPPPPTVPPPFAPSSHPRPISHYSKPSHGRLLRHKAHSHAKSRENTGHTAQRCLRRGTRGHSEETVHKGSQCTLVEADDERLWIPVRTLSPFPLCSRLARASLPVALHAQHRRPSRQPMNTVPPHIPLPTRPPTSSPPHRAPPAWALRVRHPLGPRAAVEAGETPLAVVETPPPRFPPQPPRPASGCTRQRRASDRARSAAARAASPLPVLAARPLRCRRLRRPRSRRPLRGTRRMDAPSTAPPSLTRPRPYYTRLRPPRRRVAPVAAREQRRDAIRSPSSRLRRCRAASVPPAFPMRQPQEPPCSGFAGRRGGFEGVGSVQSNTGFSCCFFSLSPSLPRPIVSGLFLPNAIPSSRSPRIRWRRNAFSGRSRKELQARSKTMTLTHPPSRPLLCSMPNGTRGTTHILAHSHFAAASPSLPCPLLPLFPRSTRSHAHSPAQPPPLFPPPAALSTYTVAVRPAPGTVGASPGPPMLMLAMGSAPAAAGTTALSPAYSAAAAAAAAATAAGARPVGSPPATSASSFGAPAPAAALCSSPLPLAGGTFSQARRTCVQLEGCSYLAPRPAALDDASPAVATPGSGGGAGVGGGGSSSMATPTTVAFSPVFGTAFPGAAGTPPFSPAPLTVLSVATETVTATFVSHVACYRVTRAHEMRMRLMGSAHWRYWEIRLWDTDALVSGWPASTYTLMPGFWPPRPLFFLQPGTCVSPLAVHVRFAFPLSVHRRGASPRASGVPFAGPASSTAAPAAAATTAATAAASAAAAAAAATAAAAAAAAAANAGTLSVGAPPAARRGYAPAPLPPRALPSVGSAARLALSASSSALPAPMNGPVPTANNAGTTGAAAPAAGTAASTDPANAPASTAAGGTGATTAEAAGTLGQHMQEESVVGLESGRGREDVSR